MRPSSSNEIATGEPMFGSEAASSTVNPSRMTNDWTASLGERAGKRGRSLGSTWGSAARIDAQAKSNVRKRGGMAKVTKFRAETPREAAEGRRCKNKSVTKRNKP